MGYVSGVGAGKTFAGISRVLRNMVEWNPGEMGAIIAPTRTMVIDVIVNEMRELGLFDRGFTYKSAYSEEPGIHGPNGSRALILSADNSRTVERLKGLNLAWWYIDEEAEVPPRAREILMQRIRTGEYRNGFITTTPKGYNHTWEFFVNGVEAEEYEHGSGHVYESEDRIAITGVPTWANPHTPDDYHKDMEDAPEEIRAQEVEGRFVEIGSGIYKPDMFEWATPETDINNDWKMQTVIGVDPAATTDSKKAESRDSDYWGVVVCEVFPRKNTVYVTDSRQRRGMTLSEGVEWLQTIDRQTENASWVVETVAAQEWLKSELEERGLWITPVNTQRNKEDKLIDLSIPISNGMVKWVDWSKMPEGPTDKPFGELRNQLLAFPEGSHDDLADALSLVVNHGPISTSSTIGIDRYHEQDLWD